MTKTSFLHRWKRSQVRPPTGTTLGQYRIVANPVTNDTTAPTAALRSAPAVLVPGGTTYELVVAYKDNRNINGGLLDEGDVLISGPGGFAQPASFVGSTISPGGAYRYATYRIAAPGGSWDFPDDGTYTITMQPNQVADLAGNFVAGSVLGTFAARVPLPGDTNGDNVTNFDDLLVLAKNYNKSGLGYTAGDFDFNGVVNFDDLLLLAKNYNSSLPSPGALPDLAPAMAAVLDPIPADTRALLTDVVTTPDKKTAASVFSSKSLRTLQKSARKVNGPAAR
jgi:hypothetical protein